MTKEANQNLVDWITEMAEGEPVEAVVIGSFGWAYEDELDERDSVPLEKHKVVLSWEEAKPLLSYKFYCGYGAPGCHAIAAWTPSWVIFVSQYDGSTSPERIARNPRPCSPPMPGG